MHACKVHLLPFLCLSADNTCELGILMLAYLLLTKDYLLVCLHSSLQLCFHCFFPFSLPAISQHMKKPDSPWVVVLVPFSRC